MFDWIRRGTDKDEPVTPDSEYWGDMTNSTSTSPWAPIINGGVATGGNYTVTGTSSTFSFADTIIQPRDEKIKRMEEQLERIEQRLAIMVPNPKLEEEYMQLKRLGDQYRELEKLIMEQERTMGILKD